MMRYSSLPPSIWGYVLETAAYILNQVPSKTVPGTPYERWTGRKVSLGHIRIWGCPAHVLRQKTSKLASRSELCLFVGYPKQTKVFTIYSPEDDKTFVSTNARFLEEDFMNNVKPRSKIVLEEKLGEECCRMKMNNDCKPRAVRSKAGPSDRTRAKSVNSKVLS